ncbi:hypothetical protein ACQ858_07425 [Variovorax ureilyticus]|uniref:hypothetical protein n=1 Tax=Variovorax ureilyticus TaxID=1836198 RepID=UPI003D66756A
MKFVIKAAACLLALSVVFVILMVAIQTLDSGKVQERLRKDVRYGGLIAGNWYPGPYGQVMDMFTECVALSAGAVPAEGQSALTRALEHRYIVGLDGEKADPCGALVSNLRDGTSVETPPYVRYWHGYDVYLRPMLWAGIPLARVHYINLILLTILSVGLIHASTRLLPMPIVAGLLGTLFLTTDLFTVPFVTVHAVGLMVCPASAWAAAVHLKSRPDDIGGLRWIALLSGAVFAFVDFLVNPPLTPALMMFLIIAATRWNRPEVSARSLLLSSASVTLTWFFSYATTWIGKWVISAIFLGPQKVIDEVLSNILRRTVGDPQGEIAKQISVHIGSATFANIQALGWPLFVLSLAIAAALLVFTLVRGRFTKDRVGDYLIVASPALIPIVWMELLRNHSIVHAWFVYRSLGLSLGIVVGASMFVLLAARRAAWSAPATRPDSILVPSRRLPTKAPQGSAFSPSRRTI